MKVGRESTAVPGVERAPNPVASQTCETWNPDGVRFLATRTGKPTAREAQSPSGKRMTREAKARQPKGNRKPNVISSTSTGFVRITGWTPGTCPDPKGG